MTINSLKERLIALAIHFLISAVIIGALLFLIYFIWFPNNLIYVGATAGLIILISVDLVIGPVLTFIVFDKSKRSLKLDLSCIAVLQIACLIYGTYLIYNERPILHILTDDGLAIFTKGEIEHHTIDLDYGLFSKPTIKFLDVPDDRAVSIRARVAYEAIEGKPYALKTELHLPADKITLEQFNDRLAFIEAGLSKSEKIVISKILETQETHPDHCTWVPLFAVHSTSGTVCIKHAQGVIDYSTGY